MALEGIQAHADDIIVTTGSQQALDLVTRIFIDPGDVILAEAPSYVGALGVFAAYQAQVAHVTSDDDGLVPAALEERIVALEAAGLRIKFLYTVPTFSNPAGTTLSMQRRPQILDICGRRSKESETPAGLCERRHAVDELDPPVLGPPEAGEASRSSASGMRPFSSQGHVDDVRLVGVEDAQGADISWALQPPPRRQGSQTGE